MFTILGLDPGSNYIGVSVFHIDSYTLELNQITTQTINVSNIESPIDFNHHIGYKLLDMSNYLTYLLNIYNPVAVAIENPFMFSKRPGAVIPLAKSLGILEDTILRFNPYILIKRISPSEVKNTLGAKGNANKDAVLEALYKHHIASLVDFNSISEHEVDACGITLSLYNQIYQNPYILL